MALLYISLTLFLSAFAATTHSLPGGAGITIDLIHRDSSRISPDSAATHSDKLYASFRRSIARAHQISQRSKRLTPSEVNAPVIPIGGEYAVELGIGTPPSKLIGIVDTGSDLIWTQCEPCVDCFEQEIPVFNPEDSSSYQALPCDGDACASLPPSEQGCTKNTCTYKYGYGDRSSTSGDLATERLTLGGSSKISNVTFGCGHNNKGTFRAPGTGLIGLGQGPLSLTAQTKDLPEFGGKFAYCLVPRSSNSSSKISFGENAVVSGKGVVSTPVSTGQVDTFYYLTLEQVTIGDETPIVFEKGSGAGPNDYEGNQGNIIIDSGTTLTFLPQSLFDEFVSKLRKLIKAEIVEDPKGTLELCYGSGDFEVPRVAFEFTDATLELAPKNVFIALERDLVCLSMLPAGDSALFGNLAQMNFLVGHDLDAKTVSFKATDCTKYV